MIVTLSKVNRPGKSRFSFLSMWIQPHKSSNTNQMGISNSVLVFEWRVDYLALVVILMLKSVYEIRIRTGTILFTTI